MMLRVSFMFQVSVPAAETERCFVCSSLPLYSRTLVVISLRLGGTWGFSSPILVLKKGVELEAIKLCVWF